MASYNKVILMGNLTRDPEVKFLPSGTALANFGLAMSERWNDKQTGEQKESVCFVDIEAWGRQAEVVGEYFSKGKPILIEGSLKYDSWETEDGTKRNRLKVRLERFQFVGRRDDNEMGEGYTEAQPVVPPGQAAAYPDTPAPDMNTSSATTEAEDKDETSDDIPF